MVQILIPSSTLVQNNKNSKPFTLFNIEIYLSGQCLQVQRRYSEFLELNKKLKKYSYQLGSLPPKKLKNLNQKLIEHRRTCLEKYLQNLLRTIGLNKVKELNEFLNLQINETSNIENLNNQQSKSLFQNNSLFNDNEVNEFNFHQSMIGLKPIDDHLFSFDAYDLTSNLSTATNIYSSDTNSCSSSNSSTNSCSSNSNCSSLPDIVVIGSLDAIYK